MRFLDVRMNCYPVDGVKYVFHTLSQPQVNGSSRLRWCSFFFIYLTTDIHLIVHDLSVICPSTPKTTVLFKKPKKKHNVWKLAKKPSVFANQPNLYWAGQHFNGNKMFKSRNLYYLNLFVFSLALENMGIFQIKNGRNIRISLEKPELGCSLRSHPRFCSIRTRFLHIKQWGATLTFDNFVFG